ncbi:MAG TPA: MIP/aquaporin family protein [Halomonas sp.]|nr:MIP/aquaporin family protein [Halomonas sp.]
MNGIRRKLLAEFVGTALLVLFGAGSIVATLTVDPQLTYAGLGFIAVAFSIVVAAVVYICGPISGAHINPAVTVALAVRHRFPWSNVIPYIIVQLLGGVAGALLIIAIFGPHSVDFRVGATALADGTSYLQGMLAEGLGTFILLLTVMALAVDERAPAGWAGAMIGLAVGLEILLIGPLTGGSVNPARTFGPYVATTLYGGGVPWLQMTVYVVGPVAGAVAAAWLYDGMASSVDDKEG